MNTVAAGPHPACLTDVRATNLAVVLRHVRIAGPCTRADIVASTGLRKATVSSLVAELVERRMLRETQLTERRIGRPAAMLVVDGSAYVGIGLELGVDHVAAVAIDLGGRRVLTWRRSFSTAERTAGRVVAEVARFARRVTARVHAGGGEVIGLNVAVPGIVDSAGVVRCAPALGWTDVALRVRLESALGTPDYPVGVHNDGTLGAVAEYRYGAHAGTAHLVYLAGPPSGRVGVVSDGVPLRGAHGYGSTIGHLVDPIGPRCSCGRRGCLDAVAGLDAVLWQAGADPGASAVDLEVAQIARRADAGDVRVLAALAAVGSWLECAVSALAHLVDPAVVLLGGHYARLAPWLLPTIAREFRPPTPASDLSGLRLAASTLGYEAPALGGAAAALDPIDPAGMAFPRTAQPSGSTPRKD